FNKHDAVAAAALFTTNANLVAPLGIFSGREMVNPQHIRDLACVLYSPDRGGKRDRRIRGPDCSSLQDPGRYRHGVTTTSRQSICESILPIVFGFLGYSHSL